MRHDRLIEFVSAHPQAAAEDNAGQGDNRYLACAPSDIDNHVARRFMDGQTDANGRTIHLVRCEDPHTVLRPGLAGVVTHVDGTGTVHVLWEDGHRLGLIPGIDAWEVADE